MAFTLGNKTYVGACLAPMAGFSDRGMRLVCRKYGAALSVTEMISAKAVVYGDRKTFSLAAIRADEGDVALQIFGSEPKIMAEAASVLARGCGEGFIPPAAIDINMGCPVHKIFSNGEGSALMRSPELIYKIVREVRGAIDLPLSVKLRAGVDERHINAVECALAAEEAGADLITVHGRTRTQMYSGTADRGVMRSVKQALRIPVLANGDVTDADIAEAVIKETGCDGVMIGRAAVGYPFIFEEINRRISGLPKREISLSERIYTALFQLTTSIEEKGELRAVTEARKQIALYFKGFRGSAALRAGINKASTLEDVKELLGAISSCEEQSE